MFLGLLGLFGLRVIIGSRVIWVIMAVFFVLKAYYTFSFGKIVLFTRVADLKVYLVCVLITDMLFLASSRMHSFFLTLRKLVV